MHAEAMQLVGEDGILHEASASSNVQPVEGEDDTAGMTVANADDTDADGISYVHRRHGHTHHHGDQDERDSSSKVSDSSMLVGENEFLHSLKWESLPADANTAHATSILINVFAALPFDLGYWHYTGSLTTPPCTEGVKWYVLKEPVSISERQRLAFINIFRRNARPTQPLYDRNITATPSSPFADYVLYNVGSPMVTQDAFISVVGGLIVVSVLLVFAVIFICTRAASTNGVGSSGDEFPFSRTPRGYVPTHAMPPDQFDLERHFGRSISLPHTNLQQATPSNIGSTSSSTRSSMSFYQSPSFQPHPFNSSVHLPHTLINNMNSGGGGTGAVGGVAGLHALSEEDFLSQVSRSSAPAAMGFEVHSQPSHAGAPHNVNSPNSTGISSPTTHTNTNSLRLFAIAPTTKDSPQEHSLLRPHSSTRNTGYGAVGSVN